MRRYLLPILLCWSVFCTAAGLYLIGRDRQMRSELNEVRQRLSHVEEFVRQRNEADPLQARECVEVNAGYSPVNPCITTLDRLAQTPQQFHNRWVRVEGKYGAGFEQSALYPVQTDMTALQRDPHTALWLSVNPESITNASAIHVVGRFKRGPAGHMGAYFGELVDATVDMPGAGAAAIRGNSGSVPAN